MLTTFSQLTTCSLRSPPPGRGPSYNIFAPFWSQLFHKFVFSFFTIFVHFSWGGVHHFCSFRLRCVSPFLFTFHVGGYTNFLLFVCDTFATRLRLGLRLGLTGVHGAFAFLFFFSFKVISKEEEHGPGSGGSGWTSGGALLNSCGVF